MALINKALASLGIGNAQVDTVIDNRELSPGDTLKGLIRMKGGKAEQRVDRIYLELKTRYSKEGLGDDRKVEHVLARTDLAQNFTLQPDEVKEFPFELPVPPETPITMHKRGVWLETGLAIPQAVDPRDRDDLAIVPGKNLQVVLDACAQLGLTFKEVEMEHDTRWNGPLPFVQEFEFKAYDGPFQGRVKEVELLFFPDPAGLKVGIEAGPHKREQKVPVLFEQALLDQGPEAVSTRLAEALEERLRKF